MTADVTYRPMVVGDVPAAGAIQRATHVQRAARLHEPHQDKPQASIAVFERTLARFVRADHEGMPLCHVAERDEAIVGYAAAIRREDLWGLALLFVTPDEQGRGIGQGLLERSLTSAADARVRLIRASDHPQAARRYFAAACACFPQPGSAGRRTEPRCPPICPGGSARPPTSTWWNTLTGRCAAQRARRTPSSRWNTGGTWSSWTDPAVVDGR